MERDLIELAELRIGSVLFYKDKYVYVSFLSMDIDDEYTDLIGVTELGKTSNEKMDWNQALYNDLKRVPLKGLQIKIPSSFSYGENHTVFIDIEKGIVEAEQYGEGREVLSHIVYLHDLQGLHYSLTGKELSVAQS